MASKKKKISLFQLLNEEGWTLCYSSEKYQYYMRHPASGIWGDETRKIKKSIVVNYLNKERKNTPMETYCSSCNFEITIKGSYSYGGLWPEDDKKITKEQIWEHVLSNHWDFTPEIKISNEKIEREV